MRSWFISALAVSLTLGLTSCGESSQLYPSSKSEGVFFSLPKSWHIVTTEELNKYESESIEDGVQSRQSLVKWQIAFSTDSKIKAAEVFDLEAPSEPLVFARVRELTSDEMNEVSYNSLRDVIVPVTRLITGEDTSVPDFKILGDEEVIEKGARGVRTTYSLSFDGVNQTFNQTSLVANDRSALYIFVVRCTTLCYEKSATNINEIVSSFTVKGTR